MPKQLDKVYKKIAKKKGRLNSLHENSRDAKRLRRASGRAEKLERVAAERANAYQPFRNDFLEPLVSVVLSITHTLTVQRIAFFQSAAQESSNPFTLDATQALIEIYLDRSTTELSALKTERRPGRPASTKDDKLSRRIEAETKEHISGFWIPDMSDADTLGKLKNWNGEWASLNTMKYVRIARDGTKHSSSFPPKGKS
ncbi:MAG: hypothetical protein Q9220_002015 [cf. Caloplaca sp. 1 TL-2023]